MMFQLTKKLLSIGITIFILCGCEYNLTKENFVDLEKPSPTQNFDLNIFPLGDTLKIFEETTFTYSIHSDNRNVLLATMTFQGNSQNFYSNSESFTIDPTAYKPGIDTLTLRIYTHSGSGSIADITGNEGYSIEKKWIVIIDGREAPTIIPTNKINKDGFLVIEWPEVENYNFVSYEIESSSGTRTITDVKRNYYIDSLYVGGGYYVRVSCIVVNDHTWGQAFNFSDDVPKPKIEEIGWDSLKISWNKSAYNAKYRLSWNNKNLLYFNTSDDTMCIIPQIGFGNVTDFELCTKSQYFQEWPDISYACNVSSSQRYYLGKQIISANNPEFGYNYSDKVVYSNEYDLMKCFNIENLLVTDSANVHQLLYYGKFSCPTNSSKVAAVALNKIYIFDDKSLSAPVIFTFKESEFFDNDHFLFTNNNSIALAYENYYKIIDVNTQKTIASMTVSDYPYYSKWACITTSQDGKYACIATNNGIKIHTIKANSIENTFSDNRNYKSAYFNPNNPNQLFLTINEEPGIEIRNPSNFELLDKIDIDPGMVIQNIDPETNNLLITDYTNLRVINTETHQVLFKVPCSGYKWWLYNSHLFTNSGFVLDISEYL